MPLTTQFVKDDFGPFNTPVAITLPADPSYTHKLTSITASYTSGGIGDVYITINAVEVYRSNVAEFNRADWVLGLFGNMNEAVVVTLDAGGVGIAGTLHVEGRTE